MFWKKKKEEMNGLPDIPLVPSSQQMQMDMYPEQVEDTAIYEENPGEIHSLPSFPDSPMKRGFSQSMIKNAIENEEAEENLPALPSFSQEQMPQLNQSQGKVVEMEEWTPSQRSPQINQRRFPTDKKPIFIRLDKFQAARESLETIKEKLTEMDELLKVIKEVKMKEDQEITNWEREIETIKARLNSITSDIFDSAYS